MTKSNLNYKPLVKVKSAINDTTLHPVQWLTVPRITPYFVDWSNFEKTRTSEKNGTTQIKSETARNKFYM